MPLTSSLIYDRNNLAEIIPTIWGERYNDYYKANLVGANFFTDRSSELRNGGDVLYTPNIVAMSANAKSQQTAVTLQVAVNGVPRLKTTSSIRVATRNDGGTSADVDDVSIVVFR